MSDTTPNQEPDEVEALTGHDEANEAGTPDDQGGSADETPIASPSADGETSDDASGDDASAPTSDDADAGAADGADATDDTGQDVEDAGTGTADSSDDPKLDAPD